MANNLTVQRLNEFASVRSMTVASLAPLVQAQLDFSPAPGRWSLNQIADHLLKSEGLYRGEIERLAAMARAGQEPYVRYTFSDIDVRPLGLPVPLLSLVEGPFRAISGNLPDAVRSFLTIVPVMPARNPSIASPRAGRPAPEVVADLRLSIARTRETIEANADLDMEVMRVDHPLTGATTVPDILLFLARHERRHQSQMEGVRSSPRFPRTPGAASPAADPGRR
jgi:uncharacterized damage-inducible protein DinB